MRPSSGREAAYRWPNCWRDQGQDFIEASSSVKPGDEEKRYAMHAFGAQFVEVRVDADLGEIRVSRFVGAFDAGRVMNAKTARSQLIGGIVFGLGMALFEETHVDGETGRIVNANVAEYLVPVNADVPDIQTILVANDERTFQSAGRQGHRRTADGRRRRGGGQRRVPRHRRAGAQTADTDRRRFDLKGVSTCKRSSTSVLPPACSACLPCRFGGGAIA